ncbi:EpsG family protein [Pseudocitrobacter faecalis]|uniref:EpsG-like putative glucosyltransferase n=1 Tax=Pseudocitrobacter faecalis TaxID=1398493 RepID=A0ABX9G462_9ENTR|nr:EpsG-like putative glucosyltransferase [Pseudocitrobacter faecalis]
MKNKSHYISIFLFFSWIILFLFAGLRVPGFDRDSYTYIDLISRPIQDIWFQEPTFIALVVINRVLFDGYYQTFFMIYALLGVGIKIFCINKMNEGRLLGFLIYLLLYYSLHDLTQIRVGVASGLFLLSLFYLDGNKKRAFILQIGAALFHYSAIVGLATLLLSTKKLNKWCWTLFVLISVAISKFMTQDFVLKIADVMPTFITVKVYNYINMLNENGIFMDFNQYNFFYLGCVLVLLLGIYLIKLKAANPLFIISIKVFALMLMSYYLLAPVPIMAGRISEFFGIVLIIYFPMFCSLIKPRYMMATFILMFVCVHAVRLNLDILNF